MNVLITLLGLILFSQAQHLAAQTLLSSQPQKLSALNFGSMTLVLPSPVAEQVKISRKGEHIYELETGTIPFTWTKFDRVSNIASEEQSSIELHAEQKPCSIAQEIDFYRSEQTKLSADQNVYKVERLALASFQGYRIYGQNLRGSDPDSISFALLDEQTARCHSIKLSLANFQGANPWQIQKALAPLSEQIERSLTAYTRESKRQEVLSHGNINFVLARTER